jgi:hypothetical protein
LIEVEEYVGVEKIFSKKDKKVENKFCGEEKNIYFCNPQMKSADSSLRLKKEYVRGRKRFIFKKD